jgi:hypothetical protein
VVVANWLFPFLDAHATLGNKQRVIHLRQWKPDYKTFPDVMYWGRPEWWVMSLDDVHARHVWLLDELMKPAQEVPPHWKLVITHRRGYVRTRLFTVSPP